VESPAQAGLFVSKGFRSTTTLSRSGSIWGPRGSISTANDDPFSDPQGGGIPQCHPTERAAPRRGAHVDLPDALRRPRRVVGPRAPGRRRPCARRRAIGSPCDRSRRPGCESSLATPPSGGARGPWRRSGRRPVRPSAVPRLPMTPREHVCAGRPRARAASTASPTVCRCRRRGSRS
jgi:hypothetical protein